MVDFFLELMYLGPAQQFLRLLSSLSLYFMSIFLTPSPSLLLKCLISKLSLFDALNINEALILLMALFSHIHGDGYQANRSIKSLSKLKILKMWYTYVFLPRPAGHILCTFPLLSLAVPFVLEVKKVLLLTWFALPAFTIVYVQLRHTKCIKAIHFIDIFILFLITVTILYVHIHIFIV